MTPHKQLVIGVFAALFLTINLPASTYTITDFGAASSSKKVNTNAIQKAIDTCSKSGGGVVLIPAGDFLCGQIFLKSNVNLHLQLGAVLRASKNKADYNFDINKPIAADTYFIICDNASHVAVTGQGIINGNVPEELAIRKDLGTRPDFRWATIKFSNCKDIQMQDIKFIDSEMWTVSFRGCDRVFVDNVTIDCNYYRTNTDGIQIASCNDVHVNNCSIKGGDDCFAIFASKEKACQNVTIANCTMQTPSSAIKIGGRYANFKDITVTNCTIVNSMVGIGFYTKGPGTTERISFSNISIGTIEDASQVNEVIARQVIPIFMDVDERSDNPGKAKVRDVVFSNIQIDSDRGILIQGMDDMQIENLTLRDINFRVRNGYDYSNRTKPWGYWKHDAPAPENRETLYARKPSYVTIANVKGLFIDNINVILNEKTLKQNPRSSLSLHQIHNGIIKSIRRTPAKSPEAIITMENCKDILLNGCHAAPKTQTFLKIIGKDTKHISLTGNNLTDAAKPVELSQHAGADQVTIK